MFAEVGKIQPVGHCATAVPAPLRITCRTICAAVAWLGSCDRNGHWKAEITSSPLQKTFADLELYDRSEASQVCMGRSGLEVIVKPSSKYQIEKSRG